MPKRASVVLNRSILPRNLRKTSQNFTRRKVLKMLAVMEAQQIAGPSNGANSSPGVTPDCGQEFLSTGRTGRRNALPDILGEHALVTSSDLPARLQSLTTNESTPSTSKDATKGETSNANS